MFLQLADGLLLAAIRIAFKSWKPDLKIQVELKKKNITKQFIDRC